MKMNDGSVQSGSEAEKYLPRVLFSLFLILLLVGAAGIAAGQATESRETFDPTGEWSGVLKGEDVKLYFSTPVTDRPGWLGSGYGAIDVTLPYEVHMKLTVVEGAIDYFGRQNYLFNGTIWVKFGSPSWSQADSFIRVPNLPCGGESRVLDATVKLEQAQFEVEIIGTINPGSAGIGMYILPYSPSAEYRYTIGGTYDPLPPYYEWSDTSLGSIPITADVTYEYTVCKFDYSLMRWIYDKEIDTGSDKVNMRLWSAEGTMMYVTVVNVAEGILGLSVPLRFTGEIHRLKLSPEEEEYMQGINKAIASKNNSELVKALIKAWKFAESDRCSQYGRGKLKAKIEEAWEKLDKSGFSEALSFGEFLDRFLHKRRVWSDGDIIKFAPVAEIKVVHPAGVFRYTSHATDLSIDHSHIIEEAGNRYFNKLKKYGNQDLAIKHAVCQYVNKLIKYDRKRSDWRMTSEIVDQGTGDCSDHANLLVNLLRELGIPAINVYIYGYTLSGKWYGHVLVAAYNWNTGKWSYHDPTNPGIYTDRVNPQAYNYWLGTVHEAFYVDPVDGTKHTLKEFFPTRL
jgi:hypothetical protein